MEIQSHLCVICKKKAELHHIRSRGSSGPDESWNLAPLCRREHQELHQIGQLTFIKKYPIYEKLLRIKGWEIVAGTLFNPKLLDK
jgi:hypothetical protein